MPRRSPPPEGAGRPNWANQTVWTGDNLDIMRGMNSASVDLIYLDPPFNSNHDYAAPIGSKAAGAAFKDTWGLDDVNLAWHGEIKHEYPGLYALLDATRQNHSDSMMSYLIYMAIRLMEMRRLLKDTGSIYLHCDPTASHYLKLLMDAVFGAKNFRNEIVWRKYGGRKNNATYRFTTQYDILLFYGASRNARFYPIFEPLSPEATREYRHTDDAGRHYRMARRGKGYETEGGRRRIYLDESPGSAIGNLWTEKGLQLAQSAKERLGYPTQKPLALVRRVVQASSQQGETVLDPFCGCATACIAAELEHRQWAGIDISSKAADLVKDRMEREVRLFYRGAHRTDIPTRTDLGKVIRYNDERNKKFLYGEQGGYCHGCEHHFELRNFHVDHIIPKAKGGTDHISNLQLLCGACNSLKGDRPQEYLLACLTDKGWIKRKKAA